MLYTIEPRELTNGYTQKAPYDSGPRTTVLEADDAADAIRQYVVQSDSELVSCSPTAPGRETIATVRKHDCVYLVRIYSN